MTTLAELVGLAPVASHGVEIDQFPATAGSWRFALELADPLATVDVEWHDLTAYYLGDMMDRGADEYGGRYRAMTVELDLLADNDDLAPWLAATPAITAATVSLDAGLLMRLSVFRVTTGSEDNVVFGADNVVFDANDVIFGVTGSGTTVEWHPLWTGRVETWGEASSARGQIRTHRVTIVDLIGDLVNVPVGANVEEFWEVRLANLLADAGWSFGYDTHGKADIVSIPIRGEQPSAINEIDATADPISIEWRTRRNGRLVFHPAAYDETHLTGGTWPNPLLDVYPAGLVFSYSPDLTDLEYVTDDDVESFGITRTALGVINTINITMPAGLYPIDDPTSIEKFGVKPYAATWIVDNEPAADQILDARAFSTAQALPMTTTVDHFGFFPAMAMVDHLDPVTIYWQTRAGGSVVTATASVRHITERRVWRREGGVSWETVLQFDIESTVVTDSLLPVEDLELGLRTSNSIEWTWTNPGGQPVEPTETQVRMIQHSLIWTDIDYPETGVTSAGLAPATTYEFQVRLVRRVNGIVTHFSPIVTSFPVSTLATAPGPGVEDPDGDDPGDTEVEIPDLDPECDLEWELQENDGTGWVTIDSGDQDDLVDNGDGTYSLDIDESVFEPGKVYRVRSREVCDGEPGDWQDGPSWDPPDDWSDPCHPVPSLLVEPYDHVSLVLYVFKVCAPDTLKEAVSDVAGGKGAFYDSILVNGDGVHAVQANSTGGLVAAFEPPQLVGGLTGDKTIACRVSVADASFVTFMDVPAAGIKLTCTPSGVSNWKPGVTVTSAAGQATALGDDLDFDTVYHVAATYDQSTGTVVLYVDGDEVNTTSFGEARDTQIGFPVCLVGAPPDSWISDCALWSTVLAELPGAGGPPTDNPVIAATFTHADIDGPVGIVAVGDTLFVSNRVTNKLVALDATNPLSLSYIGASPTTNLTSARKFVIVGTLAYVAANDSNRVTVIDISNPAAMTTTGSSPTTNMTDPHDVVRPSGSYAYAVTDSRFTRINVSNPAAITQTNSAAVGSTHQGVAVSGDGSTIYTAGSTNIYVRDITNAGVAPAAATVPTIAGQCGAVEVVGNYLYALRATDTFSIYDITTPGSPSHVGSVSDALLTATLGGISVSGTLAYVAVSTDDALVVVDISTPATPVVIGTLTHVDLDGASDCAVIGDYVFVAATNSDKIVTVEQG